MKIKLNKNRGWRGLAELVCEDEEGKTLHTTIFSFSQKMWEDLLKGYIVIELNDEFHILQFNNIHKLPQPTQQRSVLIKDFTADVLNEMTFTRSQVNFLPEFEKTLIFNFLKNRNNHTTSEWNAIGVRVTPNI
jgi:hypothetical protein